MKVLMCCGNMRHNSFSEAECKRINLYISIITAPVRTIITVSAAACGRKEISMKDFSELAHDRYSVRKFDGRDIPEEDVETIIQAGICAPTAVNNQPVKIWVFRSQEARDKLLTCTKMQFISPAKVIFMVGAKPEEAWVRPFDQKNYAEVDASIVTTHMMLEIHDLGYGSTWIGHFNAAQVQELFPETKGYELIALLPVSGIAEDCEPSPRHTQYKERNQLVSQL